MQEPEDFATPMMRQYVAIKNQYPDAILFFRLGDFYEMFLDDAKLGAQVLGITLTARDKGKDGKIPMAGVPFHAAENYIQKLVASGHKVAICEQMSEPIAGKDLVEREVVRVVTPSTVMGIETGSQPREYLLTIWSTKKIFGYAFTSITSGEVLTGEETIGLDHSRAIQNRIVELCRVYAPAEILLPADLYDDGQLLREIFATDVAVFRYAYKITDEKTASVKLTKNYAVTTLESFGISNLTTGLIALANGFEYLAETQKRPLAFFRPPKLIRSEGFLTLPAQTIRNLELFGNLRQSEHDVCFINVIDGTKTSMGKRLLRNFVLRPLAEVNAIGRRHDVVEWLKNAPELRGKLSLSFTEVPDVQRSMGRLAVQVGSGQDLASVRQTLDCGQKLLALAKANVQPELLETLALSVNWEVVASLDQLLKAAIADEPPHGLTDGGYIREGYDPPLDQLRSDAEGGRDFLAAIEKREQEATGIASLKVTYNKVFGYYIEISKANLAKVPLQYVRKQTLVNAERFIIPELKSHEERVFLAQAQALERERLLFTELTEKVLAAASTVQALADYIAHLDVFCGFAERAVRSGYTRPQINNGAEIEIINGRHPVVEQVTERAFVPNSVKLGENERLILLTGANMAGKSTYIRQIALLVIMAQLGSFIPAEKATLGIVDYVHTRIGAMDSLVSGLSTFMVEMVETAAIINNLTPRSLVVLDEIGRGTSTYDGLAIAWAVAEYLINKSAAKILFATHYHEMTAMSAVYPHVANLHMAVSVNASELVFLYHVAVGKADQSFGIEVARRAGLPPELVKRAREIITDLNAQARAVAPTLGKQLDLFTSSRVDEAE